jgi:hypothetical protein
MTHCAALTLLYAALAVCAAGAAFTCAPGDDPVQCAALGALFAATDGPTSWGTSPVASLGGAGSPTMATPFFSYYSNWQFNLTVATTNANYNVLRARPRAASRAALCAHVQNGN